MSAPALPLHRRLGRRGAVWVGIGAAAFLAYGIGDATLGDLWPRASGWKTLFGFLGGALRPALHYESAVPAGTDALLIKVVSAARQTLVFALASMALALLAAIPLALLASWSFWGRRGRRLGPIRSAVVVGVRTFLVLLRSVHELVWAVLLLSAFGLHQATAVLAIALPYAGGLAKVFAEMLDEAPHRASEALEGSGATRTQSFLFGLVPRAVPDMSAYAFYRFECAVRTSAVLGFFGLPTLGYHLKLAFENAHFRETWTYLYALLVMVLTLEAWSGWLRRRLRA